LQDCNAYIGFQVITVVSVQIVIFWVVTHCGIIRGKQRSRRATPVYIQQEWYCRVSGFLQQKIIVDSRFDRSICMEYSPGRITVSCFTIFQHINFTFDCSGPLLSSIFFTVCKLSQPSS
jgi:hypothetical protein